MFYFQYLHSDHVNSIGIIGSNCNGLKDGTKKNTINEFKIHEITMKTIAINRKVLCIVYCMQFALLCTIHISHQPPWVVNTLSFFTIVSCFSTFRIHLKLEHRASVLNSNAGWSNMGNGHIHLFGYPSIHSNCFVSHEHWTQFQQNINANNVYCAGRFYSYIHIYNSYKPETKNRKNSFLFLWNCFCLFILSFIH